MSVVVRFRQVIRTFCLKLRYLVLTRVYHMDISPSSRISLGAVLDKTNPKGIHVGNGSYIASGARVFTHDFSRGLHKDTYIGQKVFIGADSIIMCGLLLEMRLLLAQEALLLRTYLRTPLLRVIRLE